VHGFDGELQSLDGEVLGKTRPGRNLGVELVQGLDREVKCLVTTNRTEKGRPTKNRTEEGRPLKKGPHCLEMLHEKESAEKESAVHCGALGDEAQCLVSTDMAEKRRFVKQAPHWLETAVQCSAVQWKAQMSC
jgi:hypothetical protein